MITLKQLRYLTALAEHRHFGKAAEACAVTQPALSMQIRELEKDLGIDLVERRPGEVILTETGAEVARRAERVLAAARDLTEFARHSGRLLTGRLRLGVIPTLAPYVLPQILPALAAALSRPARRIARDADPHADRRAHSRRARRGAAGAAGRRERDRNDCAVRRSVPARRARARSAPRSQRVARRRARHRSAAADPARGRTLPARPGARVLRRRARRRACRARRDLALDRDADGGERLRRHAGAEDRGRSSCATSASRCCASATPSRRARSGSRGGAPRRARRTSVRSARSCARRSPHEARRGDRRGTGRPDGGRSARATAARR